MSFSKIDKHTIQRNDQRFRELLTALPNVSVQGYDKNRRVIYWNRASEFLYGYSESEAMGELLEDLIIPNEMRALVIDAHNDWIKEGVVIPATELELVNKFKQPVSVYSSHVMLYQHTDQPEMFCVDVDMSGQKNTEKALAYLTQFDRQTGVYNKQTLFEQAKAQVLDSINRDQDSAALFIGIDDLTHINNVYGYKAGDLLILEVVNRIRAIAEECDIVARYSGDVFVVLITGSNLNERIEDFCSQWQKSSSVAYSINGEKREVTTSVGVYVNKGTTESHIQIIKNAEIAMNQAKLEGKNKCLYYQRSYQNSLNRFHALLTALKTAVTNNEFSLVYQPQYNMQRKLVSCEALLRWHSEELGFVSPAEFIPVAENKNKMDMIDRWVLRAVVDQIKQWKQANKSIVPVFINLSGQSLNNPDFIDDIVSYIKGSGVPFSAIGIEITEYALVNDSDSLIGILKWLQNQGVKIALDDFGTGFSSLSYLTKFPLDYIKVDKSFIMAAPDSDQNATVTKVIFALSDSLSIQVVCEGVEEEKHFSFISAHCNHSLLQGYLLSRPIDAQSFTALLTS
jgi:diguanylate cyclase (GGDEF)-like protein